MQMLVKALLQQADLGLELLAGASGLGREIDHARVQKPGLALAGLAQAIAPRRLQILGQSEIEYLERESPEGRARANRLLFSSGLAAAIITTGLAPTVGTTDPTGVIQLADGQAYVGANFGYASAAGRLLGDSVFFDANGDGFQDPGEAGIAGVSIWR